MSLKNILKRWYYKLPLSMNTKNKILKLRRSIIGYKQEVKDNEVVVEKNDTDNRKYIEQVLNIPTVGLKSKDYIPLSNSLYERKEDDIKLFAFYLTQYCPTKENDAWWGKGTTEWNNVVRAVPQFVNHNQPRLADELGYYDLRLPEVMKRQIELAKQYGIYGFCFYYYWFGGDKRILEKPLNMFLSRADMDIPFFYCWANHNWYKKFQGTSDEVLIEMPDDPEVYLLFIDQVMDDLKDERYYKINNKPVIVIYMPSSIPNTREMLKYWDAQAKKNGFSGVYVIAVQESGSSENYTKYGYDASCEFHPTTMFNLLSLAEKKIECVNKAFSGRIYDYTKLVSLKIYNQYHPTKLYKSIMAFWDNTPRRNSRAVIFTNESLEAYKSWLKDIIKYNRENGELDDNIAFVNAWNEWGEGAYLEPDKKYGYGLLHSTREAIEESRNT